MIYKVKIDELINVNGFKFTATELLDGSVILTHFEERGKNGVTVREIPQYYGRINPKRFELNLEMPTSSLIYSAHIKRTSANFYKVSLHNNNKGIEFFTANNIAEIKQCMELFFNSIEAELKKKRTNSQ